MQKHTPTLSEVEQEVMRIIARNIMIYFGDKNKSQVMRALDGVSVRSIYHMTAGKTAAKVTTMAAIATCLDVPAWQMLLPDVEDDFDHSQLERIVVAYLKCGPNSRVHLAQTANFHAAEAGFGADI